MQPDTRGGLQPDTRGGVQPVNGCECLHFTGCFWSLEVFIEIIAFLQLSLIQHLEDGIASRGFKQYQHLELEGTELRTCS